MWFNKPPWQKRLGTKVSILTCLLVIIIIGAYIAVSISDQRRNLMDEVIRNVSLLSDSIKLSSREDMLHYSPDRLHQLVDTIGNQQSIQKVRIFNSLGGIIYSSDKSEMGLSVDKQAEQCYKCHAAQQPLVRLDTPERARIFTSAQGERLLGMISPIYNEPDCSNASCHVHPVEQKVLGVLDIDLSLNAMDQHLLAAETRLILLGLFSVGLLSFALYFIMRYSLTRPLRELIEGTLRVAKEDLDFQIPVRTEDELGVFAQSFNNMTLELKKAQASLTAWGSRLEQMVEERTRDLQVAQQQLIRSEKLASLGKLSAGVAHEINNPLTGILTFSQLLMEQFPPESAEHNDLKVIVQETIRCRNIVRGLLEFARQTSPEKSTVAVHDLLDEVIRIVSNQESFQNIKLESVYGPEFSHLMADKDQLKQVFLNILINASEAMSGEGSLRISTQWIPEQHMAKIQFSDNGPGIRPEHLDKLFDPFFTTKKMGTGLGLAVSYGIIKSHRGNIEVESTPGQGTTITITLPAECSGPEGFPEYSWNW
ncbi:MAG: PAS domain-containing sensor histidine kinase [Syntrophobacteraceae bacterium]